MKKLLILVPILFLGVKPYQQPTKQGVNNDSLTPFQKDTLVLSIINTETEIQVNISQQLDNKKQQLQNEKHRLLNEIKRIQQRKKEQRRKRQERKELEQMIKDIEKFNNRGL